MLTPEQLERLEKLRREPNPARYDDQTDRRPHVPSPLPPDEQPEDWRRYPESDENGNERPDVEEIPVERKIRR